MTLDEVVALLEKAMGPDRGLDKAVLEACGHQAVDRGKLGWEWRENGKGPWSRMPQPTASIDAALSLVPINQPWSVDMLTEPPDGSARRLIEYQSQVRMVGPINPWALAYAPTPASPSASQH